MVTHPRGLLHLVPLHRDDLLALVLAVPDQPRVVRPVSQGVLRIPPAQFSVVITGKGGIAPDNKRTLKLKLNLHFDFVQRHFGTLNNVQNVQTPRRARSLSISMLYFRKRPGLGMNLNR